MPRLEGKIAAITGGSSGIGLATAKRFVREGAYFFITGRRQAELDKAAGEIGLNVTAVKGDVASPNDLDRLYRAVAAEKGKLDILFANAGIADPVPTPDVTTEHYDKTFGVNDPEASATVRRMRLSPRRRVKSVSSEIRPGPKISTSREANKKV